MSLSRRRLLTGALGLAAAALIVPPSVAENVAEVERCARCAGPTYGSTLWVDGLGRRLCDACGDHATRPKTYSFLDRTHLRDPAGWRFVTLGPTYTGGAFYQAEASHRDGTMVIERVDVAWLRSPERDRRQLPFFSGTPAQEAYTAKLSQLRRLGIVPPDNAMNRGESRWLPAG